MTLARYSRAYSLRLAALAAILLLAFGLRLHAITQPDLNIDEAWSFIHAYNIVHPPPDLSVRTILSPEPNNALHLLMVSAIFRIIPEAMGLRFPSLAAGLMLVALTARIAYRLFGGRAAFFAAFIVALALAPVKISQTGRPYQLANLFALLSLLFWLERRGKSNMIASIAVVLFHIGALPVVMVQYLLTLIRKLRGGSVNVPQWIINRTGVYSVVLAFAFLAQLRRAQGFIYASGQTIPTPLELASNLLNGFSGGFSGLTNTLTLDRADILFLFAVALPAVILLMRHLHRNGLTFALGVPLLWIAASYSALIFMAAFSDGQLKYVHITHVAVAVSLLIAGLLAQSRRIIAYSVLTAFFIVSALNLIEYYDRPYRYYSDTLAEIASLLAEDQIVYFQQLTVLWGFSLNNPSADFILPLAAELPARPYPLAAYKDWPPPLPADCDPEPFWSDAAGLNLHHCER